MVRVEICKEKKESERWYNPTRIESAYLLLRTQTEHTQRTVIMYSTDTQILLFYILNIFLNINECFIPFSKSIQNLYVM